MQLVKIARLNLLILFIGFSIFLSSCAAFKNNSNLPSTLGEGNSGYSYIPLDPLPIFQAAGRSCPEVDVKASTTHAKNEYKSLLASLPDQAVRLAITQLNSSGSVSYGPVALGVEGSSYQVILDYITVDATQLPIYVRRVTQAGQRVSVYNNNIKVATRYETESAPRIDPNNPSPTEIKVDSTKGALVVIPVYIGVGLRLTASIIVKKGKVNLSSLASLAAAAEAGKLTGTLTVQTLGITGNIVSAALPLPSEINQTTIQNAILALGSIKAIIHDEANTVISPRVVGIYNPIGGGQDLTNGIISRLAEQPIKWYRPCTGELGK